MQLPQNSGLILVAVLTLALGVGASSWLFSMLRQWVIEAVSFSHPDQLAVLWKIDTRKGWTSGASALDFLDWRAQNSVFAMLSAWTPTEFNVTGGDIPERIQGARVSADFFRTLGVQPLAGRDFLDSEDQPGAARVAIVSYGFWRERLKSNLSNQTVNLDGEPYAIVGVVPEKFHFPMMGRANIWVPLVFTNKERSDRANGWLNVIARRKAELSAPIVEPAVTQIARNLEKQYPETNSDSGILIRILADEIGLHVGKQGIYTGFVVGLCIALIACSNLAGIYLARGLARRKEMSVRLALGAKPSRLARQLLSENALLLPAAIVLGLLVARLGGDWTSSTIPYENRGYLPNFGHVYVDTATVIYSIGLAVLSVLLFSISPVLEAYRLNLTDTLKESGSAGSAGAGSQRMRKALVMCQIVLALVVLVPAGLTAKSLSALLREDPGFHPDHVLTAQMTLPAAKYPQSAQQRGFYNQLLERLRALPQVEAVGASQHIPFGNDSRWVAFWIDGRPAPSPREVPGTLITVVTPGYASAIGLSVIRGRFIADQDGPDSLPVVVVSQTLAHRFFAAEDSLGHKLRLGRDDPTWYTIVGIVRDVKTYKLSDDPMSQSYISFAQVPGRSMSLVLRTTTDPMGLSSALESTVSALEKEQPISQVEPLDRRIRNSDAAIYSFTQFAAYFALLALFLAGIGIYGVMAYLVESRSREIGIRVACGAERSNILWLVLAGSLKLVLAGVAMGLLGAWAVARLLMSQIHGVNANDLDVYAAVVAVLCGAVLLASFLPMRRATRVDPLIVLRCE